MGVLNELKLTDKPGSVVDSHSSRPAIAPLAQAAYQGSVRAVPCEPLFGLAPGVEFTVPRTVTSRAVRSYRTLSPLPDPACTGPSAVCSLFALVVGFPRRYLAPALWSPDFPPSARLPEEDDDEAATVWSASARSIKGFTVGCHPSITIPTCKVAATFREAR